MLLRPESNTYWFGLGAPRELLSHFPTGWAIRCSLGTADLRTANDKAKALQAEWADRFSALRAGKPLPIDPAALRAQFLRRVERFLGLFDRRTIEYTPAEREERASDVRWLLSSARDSLAAGEVPEDWGDNHLAFLQYPRSPQADAEAMPFLVLKLELELEALTDSMRTFPLRVERLAARRALVTLGAPAMSAVTTAVTTASSEQQNAAMVAQRRIGDALTVWTRACTRPAKTVAAFTRHANQFATRMRDPALGALSKVDAIRFRNRLQAWAIKEGKTAPTADNALVSVRARVSVARDAGWIPVNPFERFDRGRSGQ